MVHHFYTTVKSCLFQIQSSVATQQDKTNDSGCVQTKCDVM